MKLVPTMFYDPEPKPVEEPIIIDGIPTIGQNWSSPEYKEAHNEWKRRQVEPEPFALHNSEKFDLLEADEYYNQHRLRFKGFYKTEDTDVIKLEYEGFSISFECDGTGVYINNYAGDELTLYAYYSDGMSLEYFRQTCQENEINLQEI